LLTKLFVYGTLKRHGSNNSLLDGCTYIADAVITGAALLNFGYYPGMVRAAGTVRGEVWDASSHPDCNRLIELLDAYEGVPDLYRRVSVVAIMPDNTHEFCQTYEYVGEYRGAVIPDGVWPAVARDSGSPRSEGVAATSTR